MNLLRISIGIMLLILFTYKVFTQDFTEHVVIQDYNNAVSIAGADLDGDGDMDMVASSFQGNYIAWLENDGMQNFTMHMIIEDFGNAFVLDVAHIDDDDDLDIVCAAKDDDMILWFDNDGSGCFAIDTVVSNWESASFVMARNHIFNFDLDIDGDGDTDILATSNSPGDKVSWFENDGTQNFTEHVVKENWYWARYSTACDMDGDDDIDLICTAKDGEIIWFVNDGFQNFTEDTVIANWGEPSSVQAADIDEDGDMDLAGTSVTAQEVAWFENVNNDFIKHTIKAGYNGAFSVAIADYNNDEILDIAAEAWIGSVASVFYNNGSQTFTEEVFCNTAFELIKIFSCDLDLDGDIDILGATAATNDIRWWENTLYNVSFSGSPRSGHAPLNVDFADSSTLEYPITQWAWDFDNDGIIDSYEQNAQWTYEIPGNYAPSLQVGNDSISKTITFQDYISVFDGETALEFNGDDSKLTCPAQASISITGPFSVEAWIKPYTMGQSSNFGLGRIMDKEKIVVYLVSSFSSYNDSSLVVEIEHSDGTTSVFNSQSLSIQTNEWQHIAVIYDGAEELTIYINGNEQNLNVVTPASGPIMDNADDDLIIGNSTSFPLGAFCGLIDETRLWHVSLTHSAIVQNMNNYINGNEVGLIAYYRMNDGYGNYAADLSLNVNNAILDKAIWSPGKHLDPPVSVDDKKSSQPGQFDIKVYPNPFTDYITINYTLEDDAHVRVLIFDTSGRMLSCLIDSKQGKGMYSHKWNGMCTGGTAISNGIYLIKIEINESHMTRKVVLGK